MSTKIFYNNNRIIIDGHADTPEECQAITAMCDSLANDENFKTIVYEKGHAVFEQVSGGESEMFAMQDFVMTSRYNAETGYSAAELAAKGTIKKRIDDLESDYIAVNIQLNEHKVDVENTIENFAARLAALENKLTKTLPYTADELIAKLESI